MRLNDKVVGGTTLGKTRMIWFTLCYRRRNHI